MNDDMVCDAQDLAVVKGLAIAHHLQRCDLCISCQTYAGYHKPQCKIFGINLVLGNIPTKCNSFKDAELIHAKNDLEQKEKDYQEGMKLFRKRIARAKRRLASLHYKEE
jgi:hypothetical protein